jgi:hypothetical protein
MSKWRSFFKRCHNLSTLLCSRCLARAFALAATPSCRNLCIDVFHLTGKKFDQALVFKLAVSDRKFIAVAQPPG